MAYGDTYSYTDENGKTVEYTVQPRPAQANKFVKEFGQEDRLRREDIARAKAAGVSDVSYIDYAEALENYESRPDAEPLANRRARENAVAFADQDFAREDIDIAGGLQSSTISGTSVPNGDGDASVWFKARGDGSPESSSIEASETGSA
jgi:hypothetical protein